MSSELKELFIDRKNMLKLKIPNDFAHSGVRERKEQNPPESCENKTESTTFPFHKQICVVHSS